MTSLGHQGESFSRETGSLPEFPSSVTRLKGDVSPVCVRTCTIFFPVFGSMFVL